MAYTRRYHTIVPVLPGADLDVLRWLTRESFERKAANDCLSIVDYTEDTVGTDAIPPKVAKQLDRPIRDYTWHQFTATATVTTSA